MELTEMDLNKIWDCPLIKRIKSQHNIWHIDLCVKISLLSQQQFQLLAVNQVVLGSTRLGSLLLLVLITAD